MLFEGEGIDLPEAGHAGLGLLQALFLLFAHIGNLDSLVEGNRTVRSELLDEHRRFDSEFLQGLGGKLLVSHSGFSPKQFVAVRGVFELAQSGVRLLKLPPNGLQGGIAKLARLFPALSPLLGRFAHPLRHRQRSGSPLGHTARQLRRALPAPGLTLFAFDPFRERLRAFHEGVRAPGHSSQPFLTRSQSQPRLRFAVAAFARAFVGGALGFCGSDDPFGEVVGVRLHGVAPGGQNFEFLALAAQLDVEGVQARGV